jgi:hypothetical protein
MWQAFLEEKKNPIIVYQQIGLISNQIDIVFFNAEDVWFWFLAQKKIPTNANSFWPPKNFVIEGACFLSLVGFKTWPRGIFKLAEEYLLDRVLRILLN